LLVRVTLPGCDTDTRAAEQPAPLAALLAGGTGSKEKRHRLHAAGRPLLKAAARD